MQQGWPEKVFWQTFIFTRLGCAALQIGTGRALLGAPIFWVEVLLVYIITFSLRFAERSARWLFFPNDDMVLAERELQARGSGLHEYGAGWLPSLATCFCSLSRWRWGMLW